ncbi:MAG: DUF507 family protein [Helicobacter sp.]|nr:DUF507 family protein [Helicobacter sp.]
MKLKLNHAPHVANKIALDLANSSLLDLNVPLEKIAQISSSILTEDVKVEASLDARARELMEKRQEEIEFMRLDEKKLFWMIKQQLANDMNFSLLWEDRYNELSHKILDTLLNDDLIKIKVRENQVKNLIFRAIDTYAKAYNEIEDIVLDKIKNYKRKIIVGTDEYELIFDKIYQEELRKRGF